MIFYQVARLLTKATPAKAKAKAWNDPTESFISNLKINNYSTTVPERNPLIW
jgi:hypothetical protein